MEEYILALVLTETLFLLIITVIFFYSLHKTSLLKKKDEILQDHENKQRDFIPMMVHELRAPLSVIQGASDLLLKETQSLSADQIHTLLSQVKNSSSDMLQMVGDILDITKMEVGKFEVNRVYANINSILQEESSYFQSIAKVKKINLSIQLDNTIVNSSFDPIRVKQVMNNLITNALKFTPENGSIIVTSYKTGGYVQMSVIDTGEGIPDFEKSHLFQKFSQSESHNHTKERGTGLGLYIAKGIVEAHRGRIWVEDNKPKGSKFVFTLPLN
jgi:signal transduction histidine kinase